ncbi:COX15/CtaA family protein [Glacieibacterium frigidum]|uniref:Heme A synthase n=1 Tax=Glacieibacterium frigidum TaxID=2593303 RepID=A0A552UIJ3_9SPHN|nr:COX15/CtaA family protein [Glacieibacterium frigidum]TRW18046.1 heme A synthase [Glacieibacterium frigidum]
MASIALPLAETRARPLAIANWLLGVAALVFLIVVVGGITRLTESGLSMVRWEPISGIVPPLNAADWAAEFAAYQASPQYTKINAGMTLEAFKEIYFWEYVHRVLARIFGVALLLPLLWFAVKRAIPAGYGWRLGGILALGVLQPVVGWWMVASGLVDRPSVAHERLAIHLCLALTIMGACIWTALDLREGRARLAGWAAPFLALLGVQIVWGAFTAGLRAGHAADTWPLMLGALVPPLGSIIDDPVSVQWVHRSLAWFVAAAALWIAVREGGRRGALLGGLVVLQFALGVLTVVGGVPIAIAAAHQAGAAALLAATLWLAHRGRA